MLCVSALAVLSLFDTPIDFIGDVSGSTLYVNKTGFGGAYTSIQAAINAATEGDTVFVYAGTYNEHLVVNKCINLTGEERNSTIIKGGVTGVILSVQSDWTNVSRLTFTDGYQGVNFDTVRNCRFEENNISFHKFGMEFHASYYNKIIDNYVISNFYKGIDFFGSSLNYIAGNYLSNNGVGIILGGIMNNVISNTMVNDGIQIGHGSLEYAISHNIDSSNTVNGKPVYYWKNQTGGKIPSGAGQVILANCSNVLIENQELIHSAVGVQLVHSKNNTIIANNVSSNHHGFLLYYSDGNNIANNYASNNENGVFMRSSRKNNVTGNTFSSSKYGIDLSDSNANNLTNNTVSDNFNGYYLYDSVENKITGNTFFSNDYYGIDIRDSSNNTLHHNDFIQNSIQVYLVESDGNIWDNGEGVGNYWSDYNGVDDGSSDRTVEDGIGDTEIPHPFTDQGNGYFRLDNYPLMEPNTDIFPPQIQLMSPQNNSVIQPGCIIDFIVFDNNLNTVIFSLDDDLEQPFLPSYNLSTETWSEGLHKVLVQAIDTNNNFAVKIYYFTIDSIKPDIVLNSPNNNSLVHNVTILDFSITDSNLQHTYYSLDGGTNILISDPFNITVTEWAEGHHVIQINAVDMAENSNSLCFYFTIDTISPYVITTNPSNNSQDVDINTIIIINFSEPMNQTGIENYLYLTPDVTFTPQWNQNGTICSISFIGAKQTKKTTYNLVIKSNVTDINGNPLASDFVLVFTTEDIPSDSNGSIIMDGEDLDWFLLLLVIIIAVILIVLLIGIKRKKSQKSPDSNDEPITMEETEEGKSEGPEGAQVSFKLPPDDLKPLPPPPP